MPRFEFAVQAEQAEQAAPAEAPEAALQELPKGRETLSVIRRSR